MKDLFKVTVKIGEKEQVELLFDDQSRAERFIYATTQIMTQKGKKKYLLVHRIVAKLFIENTNNAKTVNHKDGNKLNNSVSNLEWVTCQENLKHARDNGLLKTKITKEIAEKIYNDTGSIRFLAKKYNISKTQVGYIKQGKRWKKA